MELSLRRIKLNLKLEKVMENHSNNFLKESWQFSDNKEKGAAKRHTCLNSEKTWHKIVGK